MTLSTYDGQTTSSLYLRRQLDIGTTTSHVGGDGYGTLAIGRLTSQSYNVGFLLVQLSIQHLMGNTLALASFGIDIHVEHSREQLRDFDRCCTNQRRTSHVAQANNLLNDGAIFFAGCLVDAVVHIVADDRTVGGNLHHVELIDIPELTSFGNGGTRHTCQLVVHAEIVLQGDGGESLCSSLDLNVLLGLDSLVQAV